MPTIEMFVVDPGADMILWDMDGSLGQVWSGDKCYTYIHNTGLVVLGDIEGEYESPVAINPATLPIHAYPQVLAATTTTIYLGISNNPDGTSTEMWVVTIEDNSAVQDTTLPAGFNFTLWKGEFIDNNAIASLTPHLSSQGDFGLPYDQLVDVLTRTTVASGSDDSTQKYCSVWHGVIESNPHIHIPDPLDPIPQDPTEHIFIGKPSTNTPGKALVFFYDPATDTDSIAITEWQVATFSADPSLPDADHETAFWRYDAFYGTTPIKIMEASDGDMSEGIPIDPGNTAYEQLDRAWNHVYTTGPDGFDHLYANVIDHTSENPLEAAFGGSADIGSLVANIHVLRDEPDLTPPTLWPLSEYTFYDMYGGAETSNFYRMSSVGFYPGAITTLPAWIIGSTGRTTAVPAPLQSGGDFTPGEAIGSVAMHVEASVIVPGPIAVRTRFSGT